MSVQVSTNRAKLDREVAVVTAQTVERCQAALGDGERVLFATAAMEGPSPVWRAVLGGLGVVGFAAPGGLAVQAPAIVVAVVAVWMITAIWWKPRLMARTDQGLVVFVRRRGRRPGALLCRSTDLRPPHSMDVWRGFEIDGHVYWVSKAQLLGLVVS